MMLYSMKMRANKQKNGQSQHISGAEKILAENELGETAAALLSRALHHAKGRADFINLKVEVIKPDEITYIDALPVSTYNAATPEDGQKAIGEFLEKLGIQNVAAIMHEFKNTYAMRGAMLLDADTLERLEPDQDRGLRATYMDAEHTLNRQANDCKNHFQEAIVLASKVVHAPHIIAEICISDDPDYVTGYIAAPSIGYVRITRLKEMGCPDGGRIFLYRGSHKDVPECIHYLENQKVLVRKVPAIPNASWKADSWEPLKKDLEKRQQKHLYRTMKTIETPQCAHIAVKGKDLLLLASNNYLGLIDEARVKTAAVSAVTRYGTGSGGSRLTTGNLLLHESLETKLAVFKKKDAALLFNTGYMANLGVISALGTKSAVIFSDELNHASIIDGCRLSKADTIIYRHNDMADLEAKICAAVPSCGLIVSDAVFSMDGDIANLPQIMKLAQKYHLLSMVDEAHSTGVIGKTGHGIVEYYASEESPDILMGTLSKALASEGGFVCGSQLLIDYLRNTARSFIFSTSLAPAALAAAETALSILEMEPERITRLRSNTSRFCQALSREGISVKSNSAIVPIIIGDEEKAMKIAQRLFAEGVFLTAIRYPTVPKGSARLRAAVMATHSESDLITAAHKIAMAIKET
ncbi:MAG: 8-amino-7-oxononanoate synthase [Selenomonadaceae bacterium]